MVLKNKSGFVSDNNPFYSPSAYRLTPTEEERKQGFLLALSDILWSAGEEKRAVVVLQDRKKPGLLHSEEKKLQFFAQSVSIIRNQFHI